MIRKRRCLKPMKLDASKRRKLSWNSFDGVDLTSLSKRDLNLNLTFDKEILEATDLPNEQESESLQLNTIRKIRRKTVTDEKLQQLIDKCDFYLTVVKNFPKQQNLLGIVGTFYISSSEPSATLSVLFHHVINHSNKFWIYVDKSFGDHFVFVKMSDLEDESVDDDSTISLDGNSKNNSTADKNMYFNIKSSIPSEILASFQPKDVILRRSLIEEEEGTIRIDVCLTEDVIFNHMWNVSLKKINSDLQVMMSHFHGTKRTETQKKRLLIAKSDDLDQLYFEIQRRKTFDPSSSSPPTQSSSSPTQSSSSHHRHNIQPDNLRPLLRNYQKDAIRWMLQKEEAWPGEDKNKHFDALAFYEEVKFVDGAMVFFNPLMGIMCREKPRGMKASLGGILADEMGLGKSVEVLACILLNPRKNLPPPTKLPILELTNNGNWKAKKKSKKSTKKKQYVIMHGAVLRKTNFTKSVHPPQDDSPPPSSSSSSSFPIFADNPETAQVLNSEEHSYAKTPKKGSKKKKQNKSKIPAARIDGLNDFPFPGIRESGAIPRKIGKGGQNSTIAECICGGKAFEEKKSRNDDFGKLVVSCRKCGSEQHAGCVNYDLCDPYRGCYLCPHCHVAEIPVQSGATLIVTPSSILHQWIDEILKHISNDALKIFVYSGVHRQGFVQPVTLSQQDIVLTTYETLRKEIDYVDLPHASCEGPRKFRFPKRFMAVPSPIVAVEWWRICLDEAQMVECTTTKTAEMASRLACINRWCVTGTPVQRGMDDLYGLLSFLRVEPLHQKIFWNKLLYEPFCSGNKDPLYDAVSRVLWRNSKKDVIDQIMLPIQSNEMHILKFTPVEEHFYRRLYEDCLVEVTQKLSKFTGTDAKLNSLDKTFLGQLLHPLLKLRQACCHPQAVRGEFFSINKSTMTMTNLLDQLINKARLECEEAQRQIISATNGLAGWFILKEDYASAIQEYRHVIALSRNDGKVRVDPLQSIHALYNLEEVINLCPTEVRGHTLRDSELLETGKQQVEKYMKKRIEFVVKTKEAWMVQNMSVSNAEAQLTQKGRDWWCELLAWIEACGLDTQLVERVKIDLSYNTQMSDLVNQFRDTRGLQYVIFNNIDKLNNTRTSLIELLQSIDEISSVISSPSSSSTAVSSSSSSSPKKFAVLFQSTDLDNLISQTSKCCLRPEIPTRNKCPFCKSHKLFDIYESNLFNFSDKGFVDQSQDSSENGQEDSIGSTVKRRGNWSDNDVERTLKNIITMAQKYSGDKELIEFGLKHLKLFEALKKEFKVLRLFWQALREQVSSIDEITIATTRLRLREDYEEISDPPQPNVIDGRMLDQQKLKLTSDRLVGEHLLKKKISQQHYLKGLLKTHSSMDRGINPEPCPICQYKLGSKWSVMQCGHCFCMRCMRVLTTETNHRPLRNGQLKSTRGMMCPVCRQVTVLGDVSYVSIKVDDNADSRTNDKYNSNDINVKGEWSTKIEGVVRILLHIIRDDPKVKVLLFSTWADVLELLSKALTENDITFCSLASHYKFEENLHHYKEDPSIRCLLLPIHSGSNGLNLTESTHVLLVEPVLNPAQELQAIGRIHRIGQTRPTYVHRFLVKGTIEEKLHSLLSNVEIPTESRNSEETTLTLNDMSDLFSSLPSEFLDDDDDDGGDDDDADILPIENQQGDDDDDSRESGDDDDAVYLNEVS